MDENDDMLMDMLFMLLFATFALKIYRRPRRFGVRPINRQRDAKGMFNNLLKSMILHDHESFFKYTRMTPILFHHLLRLIGPKLQKDPSRHPLPPAHRLIMTLHYLAEGCSMQEIAWGHMVGHATVSVVIRETTKILWDVLKETYVAAPTTEEWTNITEAYWKRWNMPNCLGAIDGKHIAIQAPKFSGSMYFNYKKHFSIVLMASCDAYYQFKLVDIGAAGSNHDATVFKQSGFGNLILKEKMPLPEMRQLPNSRIKLPCFFTADAAFPLTSNIMRPYPGQNLGLEKKIFNYRSSRARNTIENSFGILAQRWRILRKPIVAELETCENIALATIALHNFVQRREEEIPLNERKYCPIGFADTVLPNGTIVPGLWREDPHNLPSVRKLGSNNSKLSARQNRDKLCEYLNTTGAVPWQQESVMRGALPDTL